MLRAIGTAGIVTVDFAVVGLVLLPLSVAGVPSLSPISTRALAIAPRSLQSLVVESPFFFSTLDDLTLYRLLHAYDLDKSLSLSPFLRLAVITAIILVLSIIAAIWISREISRVQEQLDLWKGSEAGGWEVGWLSMSDKIWKSPAESTSRNKVWSRAVGKPEETEYLANEMTEGRLKRIFYACGLGARQVSSTVQEVFVENVFAIPSVILFVGATCADPLRRSVISPRSIYWSSNAGARSLHSKLPPPNLSHASNPPTSCQLPRSDAAPPDPRHFSISSRQSFPTPLSPIIVSHLDSHSPHCSPRRAAISSADPVRSVPTHPER